MGKATDKLNFCPVANAIGLLQEKWTLHIVRSLLSSEKGFNELRRELGCNPATLSERLSTLECQGLIVKTIHSTMPPRSSYKLSTAGRELDNVVQSIDTWARKHLLQKPKQESA